MNIGRLALPIALLFAACGGQTPSVATPDLGTEASQTRSVTFGPIAVGAGVEKTQCITIRLGNTKAFYAGSIHNELGPASHHMIVYKVSDTVENTTPTDCQPFTDTLDPTKGSPLMITQKPDEVLALPAGVAYAVVENQMLRLEVHYVNPSTTAVMLTAKTTFNELPADQFQQAAGFIFIGNPDITLPPHAISTLGPTMFKLPADLAGASFFAITGHEHKLGTNVTVATAMADGTKADDVYDLPDWKWSESPTVYVPKTFTAPTGGGFSFTCSWNNTTDQTVKFGESTENEMCFFWAYYYPDKGARVCFHTNQAGGTGADLCCPGSPVCPLFK